MIPADATAYRGHSPVRACHGPVAKWQLTPRDSSAEVDEGLQQDFRTVVRLCYSAARGSGTQEHPLLRTLDVLVTATGP